MKTELPYTKDKVTVSILAAKGSGKSVLLASLLNEMSSGILIDMLGVFNPRRNYKTAIVPGSVYYESIEAFLEYYHQVPESKHIIDMSSYVGDGLIDASDKLCEYLIKSGRMALLIDEVADISPEAGKGSTEFHRLVKNGRNYGIRPIIMATQRPQSTQKKVLDLSDTFYVSTQRAPRTVEYILDILDKKGDKETATKIRSLQHREFLEFNGDKIQAFKVPAYRYAFKQ